MGKAGKWFRSLFGAKKSSTSAANSPPNGSSSRPTKNLTGTGGVDGGSRRNYGKRGSSAHHQANPSYIDGESLDANKHAIAVAAATAAVAEAALAAAHAAAEVVRLTTGGSGGGVSVNRTAYLSSERRRELAAVKIQSAFRAYLARRALRALKGLVKLQALVRGHIVRKQSADMLRRMQAMARVQARACANRACLSVSSHSSSRSSHSQYPRSGIASNAKGSFAQERHQLASNWLDHWMEETSWSSHRDTYAKYGQADDEKSDKILEIDTWKPRLNQKPSVRVATQNSHPVSACNHNEHRNFSSSIPQKPSPTGFAREALPLGSMIFQEASNQAVWTADNSPRVCSSSSRPGSGHRRSPFTPARSEYARSLYGDYPSYPNYMANTESSRAKLRSHSAPRQRMQFEKAGSTRRLWEWDSNSERGLNSPG